MRFGLPLPLPNSGNLLDPLQTEIWLERIFCFNIYIENCLKLNTNGIKLRYNRKNTRNISKHFRACQIKGNANSIPE